MKFLHYAALLATTSAIRLQQASEPTLFEAIELDKRVPSPEAIWKKFDKDGSNTWDLKETKAAFKATMKYFGHQLPKGWKKMVKAAFKKIDTDNSGAIDPKEMMTYMFQMVDENDDGAWDLHEVLEAIQGLAKFSKNKLIKGWKKMVTDVFNHVDKNGDGKASPKELMAALKKHGVPDINDLFEKKGQKALKVSQLIYLDKRIPNPEEVWKHFDADGNGKWNLAEAQKAFSATMDYFGHKKPQGWKKMVEAEFKKADKNGDGEVEPKEMGVYLFELVDANGDGAWDLGEVLNVVEAMARFSKNDLIDGWKKMVTDVFNHVDKDGDGKCTPKELMAAFKKHGIPDINDLFKK